MCASAILGRNLLSDIARSRPPQRIAVAAS
jgi:hypothetical protein